MLINVEKSWSGLKNDIIINKHSKDDVIVWKLSKNAKYSLSHIFAMENICILKPIRSEYVELLRILNIHDSAEIDFTSMLGKKIMQDRVIKIKEMLSLLFEKIDINYIEVLEKRYKLTDRIVAGHFDGSRYDRPIYDHCSSITGRSRIVEGKNFLVMKKDERKLLQTSFRGGIIIEIDIVSLEPRVLCKITRDENYTDMYQHVKEHVICRDVDRKSAKLGIISALYGAGTKTIKSISGLSKVDIEKIKTWFGMEGLQKQIVKNYEDNDRFKTYYGRNIYSINSPINYYVQSTAADCAYLAFNDFLENFDNSQIKLLGVIHDAIIIDCHPDCVQQIKSLKTIYETQLDIKLPVTVTEIS